MSSETRKSYVYLLRNPTTDEVWIGSSSSVNGRHAHHKSYGFTEVLALVPGGQESDEHTVQEFFRQRGHAVEGAGTSRFTGDAVYDYAAWLIGRGLAANTTEDADRLGRVPFSVWAPREFAADEAFGGQLTFLAALPAPQRPRYASTMAQKTTESDEWFSPEWMLDAARVTFMGVIDTDPASHPEAQRAYVHARIWYTKSQNGLRTDLPWIGSTWLNPPYGRGEGAAKAFIDRLIVEINAGNVTQAITCLNSDSSTSLWFQPVWDRASLHLITRGRPKFWLPGKQTSSPSKGTILSYFGPFPDRFAAAFCAYGRLVQAVECVTREVDDE